MRSLTLVLLHPDEHLLDVGGVNLEVGIDVLLELDLLRRQNDHILARLRANGFNLDDPDGCLVALAFLFRLATLD